MIYSLPMINQIITNQAMKTTLMNLFAIVCVITFQVFLYGLLIIRRFKPPLFQLLQFQNHGHNGPLTAADIHFLLSDNI